MARKPASFVPGWGVRVSLTLLFANILVGCGWWVRAVGGTGYERTKEGGPTYLA